MFQPLLFVIAQRQHQKVLCYGPLEKVLLHERQDMHLASTCLSHVIGNLLNDTAELLLALRMVPLV
jgi:hypothetical protein